MNHFQKFLSLASSLLTIHFSRYLLITSFHDSLGRPLAKPPPATNFRYLLSQEIAYIFSR